MTRSLFIVFNNETSDESWEHIKAETNKQFQIISISSTIRFPAKHLNHSYSPGDWFEIFSNATKYRGHVYVYDRKCEDEIVSNDYIYENAVEKEMAEGIIDTTAEVSFMALKGQVKTKTIYYDDFRTKFISIYNNFNTTLAAGAVIDAVSSPSISTIIEYKIIDATQDELIFEFIDNTTK